MKKQILLLALLTLMITSRAQITFENSYPASTSLTELAVSGYKYFLMDVYNNQCRIYNMDHSAWKTINLAVPEGMYLYDVRHVSENLFNTDNKLELAYVCYSYDTVLLYYTYKTWVINEDGEELLTIPGASYTEIKNAGTQGTKMLAYVYDYSVLPYTLVTQVYALPGGLPPGGTGPEGDQQLMKAYPNPATGYFMISYKLPAGAEKGELTLTNGSGVVIQRVVADRPSGEFKLDLSNQARGTYFYQMKTRSGIVGSGAIVHE
jgi:hypothetical protein